MTITTVMIRISLSTKLRLFALQLKGAGWIYSTAQIRKVSISNPIEKTLFCNPGRLYF